jgi:hypothetical protein
MEITLTQKQLEVLVKINQTKESLRAEFSKEVEREIDMLNIILETSGVKLSQGSTIKIENGKLIVSDAVAVEDTKEVEFQEVTETPVNE